MRIKALILVFALIAVMLASCGKKTNGNLDDFNDSNKYVSVYFHDNNGTVIRSDVIPKDSDIISPPSDILADGFVFKEWTPSLDNIEKDTHFTPVFVDIRKKDNVVFVPSEYSRDGETVSVTVQIGGQVLFSCLELELACDDTLKLNKIEEVDADGVCYYDKQSDKIYFSMATSGNITSGVDLFTVTFNTGLENSEIRIKINDIAYFTEDGELVSALYDIVNGKIYIN